MFDVEVLLADELLAVVPPLVPVEEWSPEEPPLLTLPVLAWVAVPLLLDEEEGSPPSGVVSAGGLLQPHPTPTQANAQAQAILRRAGRTPGLIGAVVEVARMQISAPRPTHPARRAAS